MRTHRFSPPSESCSSSGRTVPTRVVAVEDGAAPCLTCGQEVPVRRSPGVPSRYRYRRHPMAADQGTPHHELFGGPRTVGHP